MPTRTETLIVELAQLIEAELSGLDKLGRRVAANRLRAVLDRLSPTEKTGAVQVDPMNREQVLRFATKQITWGRYAGHTVGQLPREYVGWVVDQRRSRAKEAADDWRLWWSYLQGYDALPDHERPTPIED